MNIKIGEKIKQLRARDGRKQEDLASALGISPQAVSRWESSGGYPDMDLIPAIANYFRVSIDDLFGYSKDRQENIEAILNEARSAITDGGDLTQCIETLRAAAEEFPTEAEVFMNLGFALHLHGIRMGGIQADATDSPDGEHRVQNPYWQEALRALEKAITLDIGPEERGAILLLMTNLYGQMGLSDQAVALANKQNNLFMSKEMLLTLVGGKEKSRYQGEALIQLLIALKTVLTSAVHTKISLLEGQDGSLLLVELANLFEFVFRDGRCGICHYHICDLYLHAAMLECRCGGNLEMAMAYFDRGFDQKKLFDAAMVQPDYRYSAPLVEDASPVGMSIPLSATIWTGYMSAFPEEFREQIRANPKYAAYFS